MHIRLACEEASSCSLSFTFLQCQWQAPCNIMNSSGLGVVTVLLFFLCCLDLS